MSEQQTNGSSNGGAGGAAGPRRPSWLVPVLIPAVTLIIVGAAFGAFLVWFYGRDADAHVATASSGPVTTVSDVSTTQSTEAATTTTTLPETTTTEPVSTSTTEAATTTTSPVRPGTKWKKSSTSLQQAAAELRKGLPIGVDAYFPTKLPQGWALAAPNQAFGELGGGYYDHMAANPLVQLQVDNTEYPAEYMVCFTNGTEVVGVMLVIGDWSDTPFDPVTVSGKKLRIFQNDTYVAVILPGWDLGAVIGSPGARKAALEIAASLKVL